MHGIIFLSLYTKGGNTMQINVPREIAEYLNKTYSCDCGRDHLAPIKYINIDDNSLLTLTDLIIQNHFKKPFFLYDATTYSIAGEQVHTLLKQAQLPSAYYVINTKEPVPDEKTVGDILIHFDNSCDLMIAVGSGTINDLSKFISDKLKLPYLIIATAPSMDGFASNVAPLIVNHMKTTYEACAPFAIIGDTRILKDAPFCMIAAGIGDILGKYTCLCEWKIANIITGEYHCSSIEKLVRHSIDTVVSNVSLAKDRDPLAIKSIMEGLVLSGIAMSFAKNSRPASGSEHHLSHYWEMMYLFQGKKPVLHGTKVGIGTIAVLKAYELLMQLDIDFTKAEANAVKYSKDKWEADMKACYMEASEAVITLENEIGKNAPENVLPRIKTLQNNWQTLKDIVTQLPTTDSIRTMLLTLGAPDCPKSIGLDKTTFIKSFLVAKELRNRFGLLQILFDLGLSEEIAEQVWDYFNT